MKDANPSGANAPRSMHVSVPGFEVHAGLHAAGSRLAAHSHAEPTLCYVIDGRFTEYARGRALDCETDTLKLTAAGETHSNYFPHAAARGLRIDISRARFVESAAILRLLSGEFVMPRSRLAPTVRRLVAELEAPDDAASLVVESLLLELLARLARERTVGPANDLPAWLRRAEEMIRDEFTKSLSLSEVAKAVGVNASTLARAYRARFGMTVGARVRQLRIEWAAGELVATDERTSLIALRAGFYDQAHFTNVFRTVTGMSPAKYRNAARAAREC